ncbi:hypothetical protein DNI29_04125 [Hymenobacter sediminis]|uniref:hypothetical protein n=1 Tax=Hymenobacter sediminis TaxID=2218621 RepID=UPI000F4F9521|nr:hypothetical protein [Hymenobacter sediminis]RPD49990.1 hypothetical protein DNI29_04125 [Hymenobacter sediminis]
MTENQKDAYRYLLYHFLIEIRTIPVPNQPQQNDNKRIAFHSYYAGSIAYQLHNLALAAATDFVGFDELNFWNGLQQFSANNPSINLDHYQRIFNSRLAELGCSSYPPDVSKR